MNSHTANNLWQQPQECLAKKLTEYPTLTPLSGKAATLFLATAARRKNECLQAKEHKVNISPISQVRKQQSTTIKLAKAQSMELEIHPSLTCIIQVEGMMP